MQPKLGSPTTTKVDQVPSTCRCYDDLTGSQDKGPRHSSHCWLHGVVPGGFSRLQFLSLVPPDRP